MSLIAAVRTYIKTYTGLTSGAPIWVDYLGPVPTQYAVIPLPGSKTLESYLDGGSLRSFPFAFSMVASTSDDAERLKTEEFTEAFAAWLESQTEAGILPTLGIKQTAESIRAVNWGYLDQQGESDTGTYLISCQLVYEQEA